MTVEAHRHPDIMPDRERILDTMLADAGDILRKLSYERRLVADLDFPEFRDAADDIHTHYKAWRNFFIEARTAYSESGDGSYWDHEMNAFERTMEQFKIAFPQGYQRPVNPAPTDDLSRHIQKIGYYARRELTELSIFEIKQILVSAMVLATYFSQEKHRRGGQS